MGQCSRCGKPTSWWRRVYGSYSTSTGELLPNGIRGDLEFCDQSCLDAFAEKKRREEEAEKKREATAAEEAKRKAKEQAKERREKARKDRERRRLEKAEHETRTKQEAKREAEKKEIESRARLEEVKLAPLKAIQANPGEPMLYLQLADSLLSVAGILGVVKESEPSWYVPEIDTGRTRPAVDGNNRVLTGMDLVHRRAGRRIRYFALSLLQREAMEDAANNYLKAISLGIPSPYGAASVKITYAKLLWILHKSGTEYYAREAEKDLRRHLKSTPDHVAALERMIEAVSLYEDSERIREQRLSSIRARIEEAKTRKTLGRTGRAQTLPGDEENSYPENWGTVAESVRKRDGYRCSQCGARNVELHVHHIVPLSKGGDNDLDNLTTLCDYCHGEIHPRMGR
jgi:hypothetical protein